MFTPFSPELQGETPPEIEGGSGLSMCQNCVIHRRRCNRKLPCEECYIRGEQCIGYKDYISWEQGRETPVNLGASLSTPPPSRKLEYLRSIRCDNCKTRHIWCSGKPPCEGCKAHNLRCRGLDEDTPPVWNSNLQPASSSASQGSDGASSTPLFPNQPFFTQNRLADVPIVCQSSQRIDMGTPQSANNQHHRYSVAPSMPIHATESSKGIVNLAPIRVIPEKPAFIWKSGPSHTIGSGKPVPCAWLPEYAEAKILVAEYIDQLSYIQHVVHKPSLRATIDAIYWKIRKLEPVDSGRFILLLSIIASVTQIWGQHMASRGEYPLFSSSAQANAQAPFWMNAADLLIAKQHDATPNLEMVQGIIILSSVVASLEGVGMRYRFLISTAISFSRKMNLDRLQQGPVVAATNEVQLETSRRVWWYLVTTDWLLAARYNGPSEGVYELETLDTGMPKPRNLDDANLKNNDSTSDLHPDYVMDMSYFIQRLKLAEFARVLVDQKSTFSLTSTDIDSTIAMDSAPSFLQLFNYNSNAQHDNWFIQAYLLHSLTQAQRCHFHFAEIGSPESRTRCLYFACAILDAEHLLLQSNHCFVRIRFRLAATLGALFIACIVLLMEACTGPPAFFEKKLKDGKLSNALRILAEAKEQSVVAKKVWVALHGVIERYRMKGLQETGTEHRHRLTAQFGEEEHENFDAKEWQDLWSDLGEYVSSVF